MKVSPLRRIGRLGLASVALCTILAGGASADLVTPYAIYGQQGVTLGISNVTGVVASNADISVQGFSSFGGLVGGGALIATGLGGQTVGGPVTFNGNVTLGDSDVAGPVNSGGSVVLGNGATIGGSVTAAGGVTVQSNATVNGNVAAGRSATVQGGAVVNGNLGANASATIFGTVNGNVTYGQGLTLNAGFNSGKITGTATQGSIAVAPATYTPVQLASPKPFTAGGAAVTSGGTAIQPLAPGSYGALNLGFFNDLYLTAGDYYFTSFNFSGRNINYLNVAAGRGVNIFVTGDVFENTFVGSTVNGLSYSQADASLAAYVMLQAQGSINIVGAGNSFGLIQAGGDITFNGSTNVTGQVIAGGSVYAAGGITVNYVPFGVPEPASLVMAGLGLAIAAGMARARRGA